MSAVMERPMELEQPVVFRDSNVIRKNATRYLFFPLDILNPRRKQELKYLARGGEELSTPCSWRHKHFLPRAYFLILEEGATWTPADLLPEGMTDLHRGVEIEGAMWATSLPGIKEYPGEAVDNILSSAYNEGGLRKGIVEITPLVGVSWDDCVDAGWQKLFFPQAPIILRELEDQIKSVKAKTDDADIHLTVDQMLSSCDEARYWGMEKIGIENTLVRLGSKGDHVYTYSSLAETLMPQLEVTPQDKPFQELAKMQATMGESLQNALGAIAEQRGTAPDQSILLAEAVAKIGANQEFLTNALLQLLDDKKADKPKPSK